MSHVSCTIRYLVKGHLSTVFLELTELCNILDFYFPIILFNDIIVKMKLSTVSANFHIQLFKESLKWKTRLELFSAKSFLNRSSMVVYVRLH